MSGMVSAWGDCGASKKQSGRGAYPGWVISHAEFLRYQREGLLPLARNGNGHA